MKIRDDDIPFLLGDDYSSGHSFEFLLDKK